MKKPIVIKVGGSCLISAENFKHLVRLFNSESGEDFVLVVSALKNVTNLLEQWFDDSNINAFNNLKKLHKNIFEEFFPSSDFEKEFPVFLDIVNAHKKKFSRNYVLSLGEAISSRLIEMYLQKQGVDIKLFENDPLVIGNSDFFDVDSSIQNIINNYCKKQTKHIITQGYASINSHGYRTNLGREGSDLSAVLWAYALQAPCRLYKDVGAIYTADPHTDSNAYIIREISFQQYIQDFYHAGVIYHKVIDFCLIHNIDIDIYSFESFLCGTNITTEKVT